MTHDALLQVAVLGYGAIGSRVARAIASGSTPGARLAGVIVRDHVTPGQGKAAADGLAELSLAEALERADLVVECAGGPAVREVGPAVVAAGKDLLVVSVGAVADEALRLKLVEGGPGRTFFSTGAIGGLDLLAAAAVGGGLDEATITSRKLPGSIVQPWMSADEADALRAATEPTTVFEGSVAEAIERFPKSLNVAVALAQATGLWGGVRVRLVGDPAAELTKHEIHASGSSGEYAFSVLNHPLAENPASSAVVSQALVKGVAALARPSGTMV